MRPGIKIEAETLGDGREARIGDSVTIAYALSLNRGDVVQSLPTYTFTLGKRQVIAALEYGVLGMRVHGQRRLRAGAHLGYGAVGVPGVIPPHALLRLDVTLLDVTHAGA